MYVKAPKTTYVYLCVLCVTNHGTEERQKFLYCYIEPPKKV